MDQLCEHFGFTELPFSLSPNTHFFVNLRTHQQCFNTLVFALGTGEGFVKVTGEVGNGKTVLCRMLLNQLSSKEYVTAYVPNPAMPPEVLRRALAREIGIKKVDGLDHFQLIEKINQRLIDVAKQGKRTILVIDEAQALPDDSLEEVRLFSNLETEQQKLIQIVLFGQPELNQQLDQPRFRQLRQRLAFTASLDSLDFEDVDQYVTQRLHMAGYNGGKLFEKNALKALHRGCGGTPRVINVVAQKALLVAFGSSAKTVHKDHVMRALIDTEGTGTKAPFWKRWFRTRAA